MDIASMNGRHSPAFGPPGLAWAKLFNLAFFLTISICLGQTTGEVFPQSIKQQAHLTDGDLELLNHGEPVVKAVRATDRREIAVYGVIRLPASPSTGFRAFQQSMAQQKSDRAAAGNRFSEPARAEDLQTLILTHREIGDLQKCVVNDCKFKLSSRMIERFQSEVDWSRDDHKSKTITLFREMLLDYVRNYSQKGNEALIEYRDGAQPVRLEDEYNSLFQENFYLRDFAPELIDYANAYPHKQLRGVTDEIVWTRISFGLKPVVIVTHQTIDKADSENRILLVTKQIYASHYFDSSLGLTAVVKATSDGATDSYLLYVNHSRASALQSAFSGLKRKLVEREAVGNLTELLLATKANVLHPPETAMPQKHPFRLAAWLRRPVFWLGLLSLSLGLFVWVRHRVTQRNRKSAAQTA